MNFKCEENHVPWILDTIAEKHISNNGKPTIRNEESIYCFYFHRDTETKETAKIVMEDIKMEAGKDKSVLSVKALTKKGLEIKFNQDTCTISKFGKVILTGGILENEYVIYQCRKHNITGLTLNKHDTINMDNKSEHTQSLDRVTETPEDWKEVEKLPIEERKIWERAMLEEMEIINKNGVWDETTLPQGEKAIGCRWTYVVKRNQEGSVVKVRARLVAKGFSQKYGHNYYETYAPVVRHSTIRIVLAIAAKYGYITRHCDISSAFLNGDLHEKVYMKLPEGPWKNGGVGTCRLNKAIYGLKQAANSWYKRIDQSMNQIGYMASNADPCAYIKEGKKNLMFAVIHVDDILILGEDISDINHTISLLSREYVIKDLGEVKCYLGIEISRSKRENTFLLCQTTKINKLVEENFLGEAKGANTPMRIDYNKVSSDEYTTMLLDNVKYQQTIGSLLYLSTVTRPDIALSVNLLGRKVSSPSQEDWEALKRVVRYLNKTKHYKMKIGGIGDMRLHTYSDADWGGDIISRKSTSGNLHYLGESLIEWVVKKQGSVALSTAESEYISITVATQEIIWLRRLLDDLGEHQQGPTSISSDSQSGIHMANNIKHSQRTKHMDIKYCFLKDCISKGEVELKYCPGTDMWADILTKPLPRDKHEICTHHMSIQKEQSDQ